MTHHDIAFPSSRLPSGAARYSFMVKNRRKHKDTNGWGYSLFDSTGKPYEGNHALKVKACHTCHTIVKNRGYIFSTPAGESFASTKKLWSTHISFKKLKTTSLPFHIKHNLPEKIKEIEIIVGPLTKSLFSGTLDEIKPILVQRLSGQNVAAGLIGENNNFFSVVYSKSNKTCLNNQGVSSFHSLPNDRVFKNEFCRQDFN